jgi:DNA-binding transcriptional LysR family regulator
MDSETLKNFLVVAREGNITRAAQFIHITQPTLSRQMQNLEQELGRPLLIRGKRHLSLTPEGQLFRKRAEEILELFQKTRSEIHTSSEIAGDIYMGAGETDVIRQISQVASQFAQLHPQLRFHIRSGDGEAVREMLEKGLVDFGLIYGPSDPGKYKVVPLTPVDRWGFLLPRTHPLARYSELTPEQVHDQPLILSRQAMLTGIPQEWLGRDLDHLHIAGTYTLLTNGAKMVAGGLGLAMGLDGLINTSGSPLCFRPCSPPLLDTMSLIWKRGQLFTPAVQGFLDLLLQNFGKTE